jgi:type II secretory pathway pseudopilin PulG
VDTNLQAKAGEEDMRASSIAFVLAATLALISCNRSSETQRRDSTARQAGREAYRATQNIKKGAKETTEELRKAGRELRQGWEDAQREDKTRRKE